MNQRHQTGSLFVRKSKRRITLQDPGRLPYTAPADTYVCRYLVTELRNGVPTRVHKSKVIGFCAMVSLSQALTERDKLVHAINTGEHTPQETVTTLGQFWTKFESTILPTKRDSTAKFYRDTTRAYILPVLKDRRLAAISPEELQRFLITFAGRSESTIKHVRACLSVIFAQAVAWKYLRANPASGLGLPRDRKPAQRAEVLTLAEISRLAAHLFSPYREMVLLAAATGARPSELCGFQWQDIDTENHSIRVSRRIYRRRVGDTKTPQSVRDIPLSAKILEVLELLRTEPGQLIFCGPRGGPIRGDEVMNEYIRPTAEKLGLPKITWESFRRSAATALHQAVPIKTQAAILGHSPEMSLVTYTEVADESKRHAADVLGDGLCATLPKSTRKVS